MKKLYKVEFKEVLRKVVEIEAENKEEAKDIAEGMYEAEEVVLYSDDFDGDFEINVLEEEKKEDM